MTPQSEVSALFTAVGALWRSTGLMGQSRRVKGYTIATSVIPNDPVNIDVDLDTDCGAVLRLRVKARRFTGSQAVPAVSAGEMPMTTGPPVAHRPFEPAHNFPAPSAPVPPAPVHAPAPPAGAYPKAPPQPPSEPAFAFSAASAPAPDLLTGPDLMTGPDPHQATRTVPL